MSETEVLKAVKVSVVDVSIVTLPSLVVTLVSEEHFDSVFGTMFIYVLCERFQYLNYICGTAGLKLIVTSYSGWMHK